VRAFAHTGLSTAKLAPLVARQTLSFPKDSWQKRAHSAGNMIATTFVGEVQFCCASPTRTCMGSMGTKRTEY